MNKITQTITLDLVQISHNVVMARQNDKLTRDLIITITNNGRDYEISDGSYVYLRTRGANGKSKLYSATIIETNVVRADIPDFLLYVSGRHMVDVVIYDRAQTDEGEVSNEIASTESFIIYVPKKFFSEQEVMESDEANALAELILSANEATKKANDATDDLQAKLDSHHFVLTEDKDVADGVPSLDSNTKVSNIELYEATTSSKGITQLTDSISSDSTTTAATPNSVKTVYEAVAEEKSRAADAENTLQTKLDNIAPGAEVNQNAFSHVVVGASSISADSKTDTLILSEGDNISITTDESEDGITISSCHEQIPTSTDTSTAASPGAGETFTAIDSVNRDENGHVTNVNTKTITLPSTSVAVDSTLSSTSTNPVQNKVVNSALEEKLSLSGGTMTGALSLKPTTGEGGQINLNASIENTSENGIVLDQCDGTFRILGIASADGTTKTGVGTPLVINPYTKTITGGYTFTGTLSGNASTATKLGTSTVGSSTRPVYLNAGTATACSSTVGNANTPVYMNGGTITSTGKSFANYLPLSGGTMSGTLYFNNGNAYMPGYISQTNSSLTIRAPQQDSVTSPTGLTFKTCYNGILPTISGSDKLIGEGGTSMNLGSPTYNFGTMYAINFQQTSSDKKLKKDIEPLSNEITTFTNLFDKMEFVKFRWKDNNNGALETKPSCRYHYGVIAQEVENLMHENGLTNYDNGFIHSGFFLDNFTDCFITGGYRCAKEGYDYSENVYNYKNDLEYEVFNEVIEKPFSELDIGARYIHRPEIQYIMFQDVSKVRAKGKQPPLTINSIHFVDKDGNYVPITLSTDGAVSCYDPDEDIKTTNGGSQGIINDNGSLTISYSDMWCSYMIKIADDDNCYNFYDYKSIIADVDFIGEYKIYLIPKGNYQNCNFWNDRDRADEVVYDYTLNYQELTNMSLAVLQNTRNEYKAYKEESENRITNLENELAELKSLIGKS